MSRWSKARADVAIVAALLLLFFLIGGHIVRQIIAYPLPGGWDGTAHYAVTELYVRHHFPLPHGWMPEYFGGMAFPDYYPPLLYWIAGGLSWLGGSTVVAINVVFIASTLAIIGLSYSLARRLGASRIAAGLAGILVIQLLVDGGEQANFGIALRATFSVGLASHVLGYAILLATVRMAVAGTRSRRILGTGVFLALTILSNLHITLDAIALFGCALGFQIWWAPRRERFDLAISGAIGVGLGSVFWLPLLADGKWLPTYAMPPRFPGPAVIVPMAVIGALAGWWASRAKHAWVAALAVIVLGAAGLCVVDVASLVPDAPLQPWRLAAAGLFLAPIAISVPATALLARGRRGQIAVAVLAVAYSLTFRRATVYEFPLTTAREASYDRVFAALENRPTGRVLVEAGGDGADAYALQTLLPLHGHDSATGVFREASLGSLFSSALQTRFSESERVFGLDTKVDVNLLYGITSPARLSAVLRAFDVTHVVAHSQRIKDLLATLPGAKRLGGFDWVVFEMPWPDERVVVPRFEPVLVAAPFTVKRRTGTTDFIRLSEELLARGIAEYPVALQHGCALGDPAQLARFAVLLVLEPCGEPDLDALRELLSRGGRIIAARRAVADLPPDLVARMHLVEHEDDPQRFYDDLVAELQAWVPERPERARPPFVAERDRITIDAPPGAAVPVVIRDTFHPSWVASSGELYMSTFAQQLVWTDGPTTVTYTWSRSRQLALALTILSILGVLVAWRRSGRWR